MLPRSKGQVPFRPALQRHGLPRGSSGRGLLCGLFHPCLHNCGGCERGRTGSPRQDLFWHCESRAQCLRAPEEKRLDFRAPGLERSARACTQGTLGTTTWGEGFYVVTWLSKQNPEDASEMFLKLFATSRSRTIRSLLGAKSFAFLIAVRWQRVCERGTRESWRCCDSRANLRYPEERGRSWAAEGGTRLTLRRSQVRDRAANVFP